jgi:hypothetical protein
LPDRSSFCRFAGTLVSIAVAIPGSISVATYRWPKITTKSAVL